VDRHRGALWAATPEAHRALLEFLGNLDLVVRLRLPAVAADRLLEFLVLDESRIYTRGVHHHLWHRVLDVAACFEARPYLHEGAVTVTVEDDLGYAAGTWEIAAADGVGRV
ncbi:GNAT family N-acetyltransferase, partial [Micrococcus endophyticus]